MVWPLISTLSLYHWLPVAADEVSNTEPPWQNVVVPSGLAVGLVGGGIIVTSLFALVVPQRPVAVAVMIALPLKPSSQFTTPVVLLIDPAIMGDIE